MHREAPELTFAFEVHATVAPAIEIGVTTRGRRRMVVITGGTFEGSGLKGRVLPGGADWQTIYPDGSSDLEARYVLETDAGGRIAVWNRGLRWADTHVMEQLLAGGDVDPSLVYFRSAPTFETAAADLQWLSRSIFIGTGERRPSEVILQFWRVL